MIYIGYFFKYKEINYKNKVIIKVIILKIINKIFKYDRFVSKSSFYPINYFKTRFNLSKLFSCVIKNGFGYISRNSVTIILYAEIISRNVALCFYAADT